MNFISTLLKKCQFGPRLPSVMSFDALSFISLLGDGELY